MIVPDKLQYQGKEVVELHTLEEPGGGACNINGYSTYSAEDGAENGGAGGKARGYRASSSWGSRQAAGGAGNSGGKGAENGLGNKEEGTGENGTGGLLIVYCNTFHNEGTIESNGSKGGSIWRVGGGRSGGGSINIFYNQLANKGILQAIGGESSSVSEPGGTGGNGTISMGTVESKNYVGIATEIKFQEKERTLTKVLNNEEVRGNSGEETGDIQEFYAIILNERELKEKEWSTSNSAVATVDGEGKIVATGSGEADITCRAKNTEGVELTNTIKVKVQEKLYLYFYGNECTSVTGGYTKAPRTGRTYSASFNTSDIYINCNAGYGGGGVCTVNKINLQGFHSLKSYGNLAAYSSSDSGGRQISIATSNSWGSNAWPESIQKGVETGRNTGNQTLQIDDTTFSFDDEYFIFNGFNQSRGYIYSVWLEK